MLGTIFIVEGDDSFRRSVVRLLQTIGYSAKEFSSIAELGVRSFEIGDCLLIDLKVLRFQGNAGQMLSNLETIVPMVFMTGLLDESAVDWKARTTGALLQKPFTKEQLLNAIQSATIPRRPL